MAHIPIARCTSGKAAGEKPCNEKLEARMVNSFAAPSPVGPTMILRKSLPVLLCPRCDAAGTVTPEPPPMHTG